MARPNSSVLQTDRWRYEEGLNQFPSRLTGSSSSMLEEVEGHSMLFILMVDFIDMSPAAVLLR